jgi:transposase-like protein
MPQLGRRHAPDLLNAGRSASVLRAAQRELATRAPSTGANPQHHAACHQPTQPDIDAEHWIHLRTTNPIESTFATVRLRTRVTKGPGSRAAGVGMAFKLIESAQARWRAVNAPHLVALVRAGAMFENGKLIERPESDDESQAA